MKSKTILGADGATKMQQITVGMHGKGGEAGIKAIQQLAGMVDSLKQCQTPQEVYDRYLQITGYCKCCVDCNFIDQKGADELVRVSAAAGLLYRRLLRLAASSAADRAVFITFRRAYKRTGNSNHALEANAGKRGKE